jgi:pimeloyl-ACP methyl ester carboxylesterase
VTSVRHRIPELTLIEHEFAVPLDHDAPRNGAITVFARELVGDRPGAAEFPFLVYFQGGPGYEAPRTDSAPPKDSWLARALEEYRVLMLDQRGTGRSTPVGALEKMSAAQQAEYLTHFRADAIVRDAEAVRGELGIERWSVVGQSFGGFCVLTYLSFFPEALREAFIAGGLPPIGRPTDDVYVRTYSRVIDRCRRYYERYPDDRERVLEIGRQIEAGSLTLPSGDRLTARRFRQLGLMLGMGNGAEKLHTIVELPAGSPAFLHDVETGVSFPRNPLYAVIHEACYADGCSTGWSAERLMPPELTEASAFTGEHVYPWMFEDYGSLRPLREAAELLARHPWPRLYDEAQLAANEIPVAAAIYANDMYVDRELSEETAGRIRGLRPWLTNEFEHDGLSVEGRRVLDRLIGLARV